MKRRLTKEEIRLLKYEKRNGYVFAGMILSVGALFNLIDLAVTEIVYQQSLLIAIDIVIVGLSWMMLHLTNRNFNRDLKSGYQMVKKEKVSEGEEVEMYYAQHSHVLLGLALSER